jgi:DNA-directed RNA polymerase subunit RPC12/RpoP
MTKEKYKCTNCAWEGTEVSEIKKGSVGRVLPAGKCPVCGDEVEVKEYVDEEGEKVSSPGPEENLLEVGSKPKIPFWKTLQAIKGIGAKTAKDIEKVYSNEEKLRKAILEGGDLPFEKDTNKRLIAAYGVL